MKEFEYPNIPGTSPRATSKSARLVDENATFLPSQAHPAAGGKNIFAFWNTGFDTLPEYMRRNVQAWHNRLAPLGWKVFVLDCVAGSPFNVSNFIDTTDPKVVPAAFREGKLSGEFAAQHTSDLIRFPLLLKYGGVYMDTSIVLFGDLDELWSRHIGNPSSPIDFAGFTMGDPPDGITIVNFSLIASVGNPLILRAHKILLSLWRDKTCTTGMHKDPLVNHLELMHVPQEVNVIEAGKQVMVINDAVMTDYAIQIQCLGSVQHWKDADDGWDGPKYVRDHCLLMSMIEGCMSFEQMSGWNGERCWKLLSQKLPGDGEEDSPEQKLARQIVERTVAKDWCMKLGHGFSAKLFGGDTLGILWKKRIGSDCGEGTYAGWLRWAEGNLGQIAPSRWQTLPEYEPTISARLCDYLREGN